MPPVHAEGSNTSYVNEFCTVAVSAVFGGAMALLFVLDNLQRLVDRKLHGPVLWAGALLLAFVVVRAIAMCRDWFSARALCTATRRNETRPAHTFSGRTFAPWRYLVAFFPFVM